MYKEDLDLVRCECGRPGCEETMIIHGKCHFGEPTWCVYFDGELIVRCSVCAKEIVRIKVAKRDGGS